MLSLAGGLGEEAVVLHAALHGLVPVDGVVVAAATAGVVVAAGGVVTLSVAVIIVRAADPATTSSVAQTAVSDLCLLEDHVALVGPLRAIDPPVVRVTASSRLGSHLWKFPDQCPNLKSSINFCHLTSLHCQSSGQPEQRLFKMVTGNNTMRVFLPINRSCIL